MVKLVTTVSICTREFLTLPVPDYQTIMLPLLKISADGEEHSLREAIQFLAEEFELSSDELSELLPSGRQVTFDNRVGWARTYLKKAGLLNSTRRGHFRITERGRKVLSDSPSRVDAKLLERFEEFAEFKHPRRERMPDSVQQTRPTTDTPEEELEVAHQILRDAIASELLQQVKSCSPVFFENLVIDLLLQMGYGGSRREAGHAMGRTGDGGIDGIIKEDKLGLDIIYVQAKRWEGTVGRPEIQKFAGALQGQRARKGIFLSTSSFSKDAYEYTGHIDTKIILIDGVQLAGLMFDHGVGVSTVASYEVKRIDSDYFNSE